MARFDFRQGMARRQTAPPFLTPRTVGTDCYIDLNATNEPTIFLTAHYDVDYLWAENATVLGAWGPFPTSSPTTYYLYWDINFLDGELTRGSTTLAPVTQFSAPASPAVDQHWFDLNETVMKVWNGATWSEKIRLFASSLAGSVLTFYPLGTQVGLSGGVVYAGHVLYDPDGKPLQQFQRNRRGRFITTETPLHGQYSRIANFRVEAAIVQGEAQEPIPIHHAVAYSNYDELVLARNTVPGRPAIGISAEPMNPNEVRSYITKGFVTNEVDWDWSAYPVGTPLFVGATGELTPTVPQTISIQQIGTVVNPTTVFVDVHRLVSYTSASNLVPIQMERNSGNLVADDLRAASMFLNDILDVDLGSPIPGGDVLTFDSINNVWTNQPNLNELATLDDVLITALQDGEFLAYNQSSNKWVNVTGGAPPSGFLRVFGYVHVEPLPTLIWTIPHNLGSVNISAQIYDQVNEQVFPNNITILDVNTIQIDFTAPQDGRAHLMLFV